MESYVDSVREGRTSPSVLLAEIIKVRGRKPDDPIFVFEGVDDVGVYKEWLRLVAHELTYQCLPGKGKTQLLRLTDRFRAEKSDQSARVWFFIDRDFDGMRGLQPGDDVYISARYSIENYLVSERVVNDFLVDEIRCAHEIDIRAQLIERFQKFLSSLESAMKPMNLRLYIAKMNNIDVQGKKEKLGSFFKIDIDSADFVGDEKMAIKLAREPTRAESDSFVDSFHQINFMEGYRGKWLFWAFRQWLNLVYEDRRADKPTLFAERQPELGSSPLTMDMRQFASRCDPPSCLEVFLRKVTIALGR